MSRNKKSPADAATSTGAQCKALKTYQCYCTTISANCNMFAPLFEGV
nr:MAG TPA: hypothetical protein [Caudoviricetes sp.]